MKILFIGDVVGQQACEALTGFLPSFKHKNNVDLTIINGENSADGNGITPYSAKLLLDGGADVITTGNHCFKRKEAEAFYGECDRIIRPYNLGTEAAGRGYTILDYGKYTVAVVNLIGITYMPFSDNPFKEIDALLKQIETKNIIVDFHAEASAEKKAMGFYLSSRVSAVFGTHTHVQTADETILNKHTAYITDVGMSGVTDSILGIDKNVIIERFMSYYPRKHTYAAGEFFINAVIFDLDVKSGAAASIIRINEKIV